MSTTKVRPRLSKAILEMKFMQRTKAKVDKELEEAEGREMYSQEITNKMLHSNSNFIMEASFVNCENLIEGRLSFRGMNPEIERLLELEQAEREATQKHEQVKEVSDREMAAFYYGQKAPAAAKTMQKKFLTKAQQRAKRRNDESVGSNKKMKFQKPRDDD